jgi:hypothetical protein
MSRRKTRVTRMSRRKARSGTRKQKGGGLFGFLSGWLGKKPETNTGATGATGAPATNPIKPNGHAPPPGGAPPAQVGGARKTRHRRRHHRK